MPVTLQAIADRVGVSSAAVSMALRDKPGVAAGMRRRIQEVADEIGYRPNAAARSTQSGRFGQIALVGSSERSHSWRNTELIDGVFESADRHGLHLLYATVDQARLMDPDEVPRVFRELRVDGVVINYRYDAPAALERVLGHGTLPAVWLGASRQSDCVRHDEAEAAERMTTAMLEAGHRRVALVGDHPAEAGSREVRRPALRMRRAGYLRAMRRAGLAPQLLGGERWNLTRSPGRALASFEALLGERERPTGLILASSALVPRLDVLLAAADRAGLEVPRDLSLGVFDNAPVFDRGRPIATMMPPQMRIGREAVELLLRKIASPQRVFDTVKTPLVWDPGQSIAPPVEASA